MTTKILEIKEIRIDGGTQPRVSINQNVVSDYADLLQDDTKFPPVAVYYDGTEYWLADGFHRYWANRKLEREFIEAAVHEGTRRDAILYSVGANADHGLRRTNADKRKAVLILLKDEEWSQWSDREIARECGVGNEMVSRNRRILCDSHSMKSKKTSGRTFVHHKTGKPAKMNTSQIGKSSKPAHTSIKSSIETEMNPVRQPSPALAQTNLNLPHDPTYGARAIVQALGMDYARKLIVSLTACVNEKNGM